MKLGRVGVLVAIGIVLGSPALASNAYTPSIYPPPVHSRGGALAACPNPAGLESFNIAAITSATVLARGYALISEATDLSISDRAWWPQVRRMWRRRRLDKGSVGQISGQGPAARNPYSVIVRFSCGQSVVAKSLVVDVGPRPTHAPSCGDCVSQLFFVDRRNHPLIYYVH
jgi:hypothetical protein